MAQSVLVLPPTMDQVIVWYVSSEPSASLIRAITVSAAMVSLAYRSVEIL